MATIKNRLSPLKIDKRSELINLLNVTIENNKEDSFKEKIAALHLKKALISHIIITEKNGFLIPGFDQSLPDWVGVFLENTYLKVHNQLASQQNG